MLIDSQFMKFRLTTDAFKSYVPLIVNEVESFLKNKPDFQGQSGRINLSAIMAEITIYTASRTLQGREVRERFDSEFAHLFHDLDMGFTPINFMFNWAPLPQNRARDRAQRKVAETYTDIIKARRAGKVSGEKEMDMIWHLMESTYKNGTPVPDMEIAHMMIALLMAGQHSSSSSSAWIMLRLGESPHLIEELYQEQIRELGADLPPLTYEGLGKLSLQLAVIKETLRIHTPIHSIMRAVKSPMPVAGTNYVIPPGRTLMASPGVASRMPEYFPEPLKWDPHRWDAGATGVRLGDVKEEIEDYGYGAISKGASSPYLPFGAGRHRCIGEQFATLQLGTILATMVRELRWKLPEGKEGGLETDYSSLFSRPMDPAEIVYEKREKKVEKN